MMSLQPPRFLEPAAVAFAIVGLLACGRVTSELVDASSEAQELDAGGDRLDASAGEPDACAESEREFCLRSRACGQVTALDLCGVERTAECGCFTPGEVCGGGGEVGVCAAHPELRGVDGYIYHTQDGRLSIRFGLDGVPGTGGSCCNDTVGGARDAFPDRNLVYLPEASGDEIEEGVIPALAGVDGYIVPANEALQIERAIDGAMTGAAPICCYTSISAARADNDELNLAALP
jgi:hypothetical protein